LPLEGPKKGKVLWVRRKTTRNLALESSFQKRESIQGFGRNLGKKLEKTGEATVGRKGKEWPNTKMPDGKKIWRYNGEREDGKLWAGNPVLTRKGGRTAGRSVRKKKWG